MVKVPKTKMPEPGDVEVTSVQAEEEEEIGVMMGWEEEIMKETVKKLTEGHPEFGNLTVLNIGFGLGIVRPLFPSLSKQCSNQVWLRSTASSNPSSTLHLNTSSSSLTPMSSLTCEQKDGLTSPT